MKSARALLFFVLLSCQCYGQKSDTLKMPVKVPEFSAGQPDYRFGGWIGYTTSRTEHPFAVSNNYNWFPSVQDRIHDFSFLGSYRFTNWFLLSANLIQSNGNLVNGRLGYAYNSYGTPGTKRLDAAATLFGQAHPNFQNSWSLRVYNVNGYWDPESGGAGIVENKILPKPVPAVSWNITFH